MKIFPLHTILTKINEQLLYNKHFVQILDIQFAIHRITRMHYKY